MCVDYIKPPSDGYPEKTCATITIGTINIAEALISKGIIIDYLVFPVEHEGVSFAEKNNISNESQIKDVGIPKEQFCYTNGHK